MFPENGGRIGTYFHLFPTYAQGKKIIWDGIDKTGFKVTDHFPDALVKHRNETDMQVELVNGSIYQVIGTDKIDSIVGTNPVGCVFSEYALQNPRAYDLLSPILLENGGWTIFNFTPRGHNHAEGLYQMAKANPDWYCSLQTVEDTKDWDGQAILSRVKVEAERERLVAQGKSTTDADTLIEQEYYCSFEGFLEGSYYTEQLRQARTDGRVGNVPWLSSLPVYTFWDIGVGDATAIWFAQAQGQRLNFIDYYENNGQFVGHYAKHLQSKPYVYGRHYWPHDGKVRDWSNIKNHDRKQTGEGLGIRPIHVVERGDIDDGISDVRVIFSRCCFDSKKCAPGLNALSNYHKELDEKDNVFELKPKHDWSSNGADAFRTMAKSRWWASIGQRTYERTMPPSFMST